MNLELELAPGCGRHHFEKLLLHETHLKSLPREQGLEGPNGLRPGKRRLVAEGKGPPKWLVLPNQRAINQATVERHELVKVHLFQVNRAFWQNLNIVDLLTRCATLGPHH